MCTLKWKKKMNKLISYAPIFLHAAVFSIVYPGVLPLPLLLIEFAWCLVRKIPAYDSQWISYSLLAYRAVRLRQNSECILDECNIPDYAAYMLLLASIVAWVSPEVYVPKEIIPEKPSRLRMV